MKTEWDYTELAAAYLKRPDYAMEAIDKLISITGIKKGAMVCDVGAGAAHLTKVLAAREFLVKAVEPNDAMRSNGIKQTVKYPNVEWFEGVGEHTGQPSNTFDLVTFGSSFNVTNRQEALVETKRILKRDGWFACMWNHRDLSDPLQAKIEAVIKKHVPEYSYGTRREDQTDVIKESNLFDCIQSFSGKVVHKVPSDDVIEGWRSHGTVHRQAPELFEVIIGDIADVIRAEHSDTITIPYVTHVWCARVKK